MMIFFSFNRGHRNGSLPPLDRVGTADAPLSYKEHRMKSPVCTTKELIQFLMVTKNKSPSALQVYVMFYFKKL